MRKKKIIILYLQEEAVLLDVKCYFFTYSWEKMSFIPKQLNVNVIYAVETSKSTQLFDNILLMMKK